MSRQRPAIGNCSRPAASSSSRSSARPAAAPPLGGETTGTIGPLNGMFRGDYARKWTLSEYGFRLPSCIDSRPLKFEEWEQMRPQTVYVSATPGDWELQQTGGVFVEQVIRPTGLIDPICIIRPTESQVDDLIGECRDVAARGMQIGRAQV